MVAQSLMRCDGEGNGVIIVYLVIYMKNKRSVTIDDLFMNKSFYDFLKPTKITVVASFVFLFGFFYLYYLYGFLDEVNTFLIGDPKEYRDTLTIPAVDTWDIWGLGIILQMTFYFLLIYFVASFVSWVFYKLIKQK